MRDAVGGEGEGQAVDHDLLHEDLDRRGEGAVPIRRGKHDGVGLHEGAGGLERRIGIVPCRKQSVPPGQGLGRERAKVHLLQIQLADLALPAGKKLLRKPPGPRLRPHAGVDKQ